MYVLGRRVHEYQVGLAVLAAVPLAMALGRGGISPSSIVLALTGAWLVVKDWRDILPSRRDTSLWRLGVHRAAAPLRGARRADGLPSIAAAVAFTVGIVNLLSALTPDVAWRGRLLLSLEPLQVVPVFHTLAIPASVGLLVVSVNLARRRRRAWQLAFGLLVVLGLLNLLKGLDFEEALLSWAGAGLLWWGRDCFHVRHDPVRRPVLALAAALCAGAALLGTVLAWATAPVRPGPHLLGQETAALLTWHEGPMSFHDELLWVPLGIGALSLLGVLVAAYVLLRPLSVPMQLPGEDERQRVRELVRAHGADTLAFFKLRADLHYLFSPDGQAFVAYRVCGGVMVIAGDPVGAEASLPAALREAIVFAEQHGLRLAGIGAGRVSLDLFRHAGLKSLYIGDEAIVATSSFSLEGRQVRKIRQSVARLQRAGYEAALHELGSLGSETLSALQEVSERWRDGAPERGFSMALDSLGGAFQTDSLVVIGRDDEGRIRGFLHLVPVYGRTGVSLSIMRRDRDTPNGLIEFLVVQAIELLRERGVEEISLNFAAFARYMHCPQHVVERMLGRSIALANPFFQIESLYRFNEKFHPRWEPRYLVYERTLGLPRTGLAVLAAEGQLPSLWRSPEGALA